LLSHEFQSIQYWNKILHFKMICCWIFFKRIWSSKSHNIPRDTFFHVLGSNLWTPYFFRSGQFTNDMIMMLELKQCCKKKTIKCRFFTAKFIQFNNIEASRLPHPLNRLPHSLQWATQAASHWRVVSSGLNDTLKPWGARRSYL